MEGLNPRTMGDDVLLDECERAVWRAAEGESRGGDDRSYNWAMELMTESQRRHEAAGHGKRCHSDIYSQAHEKAIAGHAGRRAETLACSCGAER